MSVCMCTTNWRQLMRWHARIACKCKSQGWNAGVGTIKVVDAWLQLIDSFALSFFPFPHRWLLCTSIGMDDGQSSKCLLSHAIVANRGDVIAMWPTLSLPWDWDNHYSSLSRSRKSSVSRNGDDRPTFGPWPTDALPLPNVEPNHISWICSHRWRLLIMVRHKQWIDVFHYTPLMDYNTSLGRVDWIVSKIQHSLAK